MTKLFYWVLLAAFFFVFAESNYLIAHKTILEKEVIYNRPVQVLNRIYNLGENSVLNITVSDESWSQDKFEISGATSFHIENLPPNTNYSHIFLVKPKFTGFYETASSTIQFQVADSVDVFTAFSSDAGVIQVLTRGKTDRFRSTHIDSWIVVLLLSLGATVPAGLVWRSYSFTYKKKF